MAQHNLMLRYVVDLIATLCEKGMKDLVEQCGGHDVIDVCLIQPNNKQTWDLTNKIFSEYFSNRQCENIN